MKGLSGRNPRRLPLATSVELLSSALTCISAGILEVASMCSSINLSVGASFRALYGGGKQNTRHCVGSGVNGVLLLVVGVMVRDSVSLCKYAKLL